MLLVVVEVATVLVVAAIVTIQEAALVVAMAGVAILHSKVVHQSVQEYIGDTNTMTQQINGEEISQNSAQIESNEQILSTAEHTTNTIDLREDSVQPACMDPRENQALSPDHAPANPVTAAGALSPSRATDAVSTPTTPRSTSVQSTPMRGSAAATLPDQASEDATRAVLIAACRSRSPGQPLAAEALTHHPTSPTACRRRRNPCPPSQPKLKPSSAFTAEAPAPHRRRGGWAVLLLRHEVRSLSFGHFLGDSSSTNKTEPFRGFDDEMRSIVACNLRGKGNQITSRDKSISDELN
ncbi:hypothetical protein GUJ93_ZPchr0004g38503 [Zizania palustris]|uniref:Uncharacterized protein n=1 Tax=Zizania palustris TaxID=103762 RepID=A0A8J5RZB6_ZIZPA|nr:hypothetical protein GUJ93_ZPchr0004g38503 [Zizania palustris]